MKKLILKNILIKNDPIIVKIISTIAKLKNLIECAPSPSFPKIFLNSLNGQLIFYLNIRYIIYIKYDIRDYWIIIIYWWNFFKCCYDGCLS